MAGKCLMDAPDLVNWVNSSHWNYSRDAQFHRLSRFFIFLKSFKFSLWNLLVNFAALF